VSTHGRISGKKQTAGKKGDNQVRMVFHPGLPPCPELAANPPGSGGKLQPRGQVSQSNPAGQRCSRLLCSSVFRAQAGLTALSPLSLQCPNSVLLLLPGTANGVSPVIAGISLVLPRPMMASHGYFRLN